MPRPVPLILFLCLVLATPARVVPVRADSAIRTNSPESYIAGLFQATAESATAAPSIESATNAVDALTAPTVPLDELARFLLGRYLPQSDKSAGALRFQGDFRRFVAEAVARAFRAHPGATLTVSGSRSRPDGTVLVLSALRMRPGQPALPMNWTVRPGADGRPTQLLDVALAGIGARTMLRSMAEAVMAEKDAGIADIIPRFRAALRRDTPGPDPVESAAGDAP